MIPRWPWWNVFMLGQPLHPTDYDLRFSIFRIPVRVHPLFWLMGAFLGWRDRRLDLTVVNIACVFVSILVHELGHALMTRRLGWYPEIVLGPMGGYATSREHSRWGNVKVAAAGPAAGFLLFALAWFLLRTPAAVMAIARSEYLIEAIGTMLVINWGWNVMNLIPVWPLDGSRIAKELIGRFVAGDAWQTTLKMSIFLSAALVAWTIINPHQVEALLWLDPTFLGVLFGLLAFQNVQTLQMSQMGRW